MKPKASLRRFFSLSALALAGAFTPNVAMAQYTWTPTAAGTYNWDNASAQNNWTSGFPNAIGDIANLNINLTGNQIINLNQAITVGTINLGDSTSGYVTTTIAPNGGSLIMDVASGSATIAKTPTGNTVTDTISAGIQLNDNLIVNNAATNASGVLALTGIISQSGGDQSLTKDGVGYLTLSGNNSYNGGTILNAGRLTLNHASALGTGSLTINGGTLRVDQSFAGNNQIVVNENFAFSGASSSITTGGGQMRLAKVITISGGGDNAAGNSSGPVISNVITDSVGGNTLNALDIIYSVTGSTSGIGISAPITLRATQTLNATVSQSTSGITFLGAIGDGGLGYGLTLGGTQATPTAAISRGPGVIFAGNNTYTGQTTVNSGAVFVLGRNTSGSLSPSSSILNNGTFVYNRTDTLTQGTNFGTISGTGNVQQSAGTTVVNAANTYTGSTTTFGGTLQIAAASTGSVGAITSGPLGRGTLALNAGTLSSNNTTARTILNPVSVTGNTILGNATNNGALNFSDAVTLTGSRTLTVNSAVNFNNTTGGAFTLSKAGTGTLSLNGNTTVSSLVSDTGSNSGTITLGSGTTLNASTAVFIGGIDTLGNTGSNGTLATSGSGTTTIYTPKMGIGMQKANTGAFNLSSGATLALEGVSGGRTLLQIGYNASTDGIARTATGTMNLSAGTATLKLSQLVIGQQINAGAFMDAGNGTLTFSSNAGNILDVSANGVSAVIVGSTNTTSNGMASIGSLTFGGGTGTIATTASNTGILVGEKIGASTSTATGNVTLNGGTLTITTGGAAVAGGGGTSNLALAGGVTLKAGATSTNWITGLTTAVINAGGAIIDTNTHDIGISQAFSGAGGLTKSGVGILTLNGSNTYNGTTAITDGTLALGSNDRISNSSALSMSGGTFNLGGFTETVAAVSVSSGTISNGTLTGTSYAFTNSGSVSANLAGGANLTKSGAGTLTISSTQSYTGTTNVTGGTLVVDGNISTSSLTTIGNGTDSATLEGIGTVGDLTIAANAFHNPGNSPGIMDTGDYNMAGTLTAEILGLNPGTEHDQVDVTGTVNLSGSLVATFGGGTYSEDDLIFLLLNNDTDAISGTFSNYDNGDIVANYGGFDWQISYFADFDGTPTFTGGNDVALMALSTIPEPGAALLGSLGALLLLRRRRVA